MTPVASPPNKQNLKVDLQLKDLYTNIQPELDLVEKRLRSYASSSNQLISEIGDYLLQKSGKRMRPALVILSSKLLDYEGSDHIFMSALVELIHTASLIHDDIIDNSQRRRGKETVHERWGPNITVLLGDYLYIKSIGLSLQANYERVNRVLTDVTTLMIEGELTEYYLSGNMEITEQDYFEIIDKKTASLFSASCQIGGILGKALPEEEQSLMDYGTNLGLAFQIIDDLLDISGNEKILGKPVLSDLSEGRITLPLIYAVKKASRAERDRISGFLRANDLDRQARNEILDIVTSSGALDYASQRAEEYALKSQEIISRFPESPHRETLSQLPEFVIRRKR
jgi:octaprenyl-diphosphate synthase